MKSMIFKNCRLSRDSFSGQNEVKTICFIDFFILLIRQKVGSIINCKIFKNDLKYFHFKLGTRKKMHDESAECENWKIIHFSNEAESSAT